MWYLCRRFQTSDSGILWAESLESAQEMLTTLWGSHPHYIIPFQDELDEGSDHRILHPD